LITQSALAALDLLNELLSNKQAKQKLTDDVETLHSVVDTTMHWITVLASDLLRALQLPSDLLPLTGVLLTGGFDVNSVADSRAVAFAAGEGNVFILLESDQ
jgi:hypothetical protein